MYLQYYFESTLRYLGHVFDIVIHRPIANLTVQVVEINQNTILKSSPSVYYAVTTDLPFLTFSTQFESHSTEIGTKTSRRTLSKPTKCISDAGRTTADQVARECTLVFSWQRKAGKDVGRKQRNDWGLLERPVTRSPLASVS